MEILIFWIICAFVAAIIASNKGRSGAGWFVLAFLLSPLMILIVAVLPSLKQPVITVGGEVATPDTHVRCPDCRELVRKDARKCKHCGTSLIPQP